MPAKRKRNKYLDLEAGCADTAARARRTESAPWCGDDPRYGVTLGSEDTDSDPDPDSDVGPPASVAAPAKHVIAYPPRHAYRTTDAMLVAWWGLVCDVARGADLRASGRHVAFLQDLYRLGVKPVVDVEPDSSDRDGTGTVVRQLARQVAQAPGAGSTHRRLGADALADLVGAGRGQCAATQAALTAGARRWTVPTQTGTAESFCVNKPAHEVLEAIDYLTHLPARLHRYVAEWRAAHAGAAPRPGGAPRNRPSEASGPPEPATGGPGVPDSESPPKPEFEAEFVEHLRAEYPKLARFAGRAVGPR